MTDWGLDVWQPEEMDLSEFFEDDPNGPPDSTNKIVLEYSEEDYDLVLQAFEDRSKEDIVYQNGNGFSKEAIVFHLLGL